MTSTNMGRSGDREGAHLEKGRVSVPAGFARKLTEARESLEDATGWLLARENGEGDLVAAAVSPYLRLFGLLLGAWLLARSAADAQKLLSGEPAAEGFPLNYAPDFLGARIRLASFYGSNCLCEATALREAIISGSADVVDFEDKFQNA